jgi:hypothetical protein
MIYKIFGLFLAVFGFLILKFFPDMGSYQHSGMTLSAILIGVVLILVGIGLLVFG